MRKRITVAQLQLGMYIDSFEAAWLDHPFWRSRFLLKDASALERIQTSDIQHLWINTDLGRDVDVATPEVTPKPAATPAPLPAPLQADLQQAAQTCHMAQEAVTHMFAEARMGRAIDTSVVRAVVEDISASVATHGMAIISLARLKTADNYTYMHSVAVCALMVALAKQLGMPPEQVRTAGFAGLVHDIGKIAIPLEILNKPGKLTDAEFELVKTHPQRGWELLQKAGVTDPVALDVCLHHHEHINGRGYPKQLAGENISLWARMGAVCDIYDAITSNRPYKAGWDPAESLSRMGQWTDTHLDKAVFQAFVRSLGIYPVGSLVRLSDETLAVVTAQTPHALTKPAVMQFFSVRHNSRLPSTPINLADANVTLHIVERENPTQWGFTDLDAMWSGGVIT